MAKVILSKIFRGIETPTPRALLLTDSVEACGRGLLYTLIKSHLRLGTNVLYLTTTLSHHCIQAHVKDNDTTGKLLIIDGASDPCGWDENDQGISLSQPLPLIFSKIYDGDTDKKVVFVIDKVEHILSHQETVDLIRGIHALTTGDKVEQGIIYCGRDAVEESVMSALTYISSASVHLMPTSPLSCRIVLKKPSGKVLKSHEEFSISPDLEIRDVRLVQNKTEPVSMADDSADSILASQTTFSLTLTNSQRSAKNNLLLPHTRVQSEDNGGSGLIHYTPDDADDWDDDDPDDDLDI